MAGEEEEEERRAREELRLNEEWLNQMRGWLMTIAILAASITYNADIKPPGGFCPDKSTPSPIRYTIYSTCNAGSFVSSITIILFLFNQRFFHSEMRLAMLNAIVVADMVSLVVAFGAHNPLHSDLVLGIVFSFLMIFFFTLAFNIRGNRNIPMSSQERDVGRGLRGVELGDGFDDRPILGYEQLHGGREELGADHHGRGGRGI